jgi:hypothetical protein
MTLPGTALTSVQAPLATLYLDFRQAMTLSWPSVFDILDSVSKMIEEIGYHRESELYVHAKCREPAREMIVRRFRRAARPPSSQIP